MARLESAGIHCRACSCVRTYTGSTVVGDKLCESCEHELRAHQVDAQAFYLDASDRLPPGVALGAHFE